MFVLLFHCVVLNLKFGDKLRSLNKGLNWEIDRKSTSESGVAIIYEFESVSVTISIFV